MAEEITRTINRYGLTTDGEHIRARTAPPAGIIEQIKAHKEQYIEAIRALEAECDKRKAALAAKEAAERAARAEEIRAIRAGERAIEPTYRNGEYLSGYTVYGPAAELLGEVGLGKYVDGWGHHIPDEAVVALGKSFTYQAAAEYMRPAREAAEAAKRAKQAKVDAALAEARRTGKPVSLVTWMEECDGSARDCSMDAVSKWAMPDGTTKVTRTHTY